MNNPGMGAALPEYRVSITVFIFS